MEHDIKRVRVFIVVYENGRMFVTDSRQETMMFVQGLVEKHIAFKFVSYDSLTDFIVEA